MLPPLFFPPLLSNMSGGTSIYTSSGRVIEEHWKQWLRLRLTRSILCSLFQTQTLFLLKNLNPWEVLLFPLEPPYGTLNRKRQLCCPWGSHGKADTQGLKQHSGQQPQNKQPELPVYLSSFMGGLALKLQQGDKPHPCTKSLRCQGRAMSGI